MRKICNWQLIVKLKFISNKHTVSFNLVQQCLQPRKWHLKNRTETQRTEQKNKEQNHTEQEHTEQEHTEHNGIKQNRTCLTWNSLLCCLFLVEVSGIAPPNTYKWPLILSKVLYLQSPKLARCQGDGQCSYNASLWIRLDPEYRIIQNAHPS